MMGSYAVCGQYPGAVPEGATVHLRCTGTDLPPARYVIAQFPITDHMNFCEIDVCAYGKFFLVCRRKGLKVSSSIQWRIQRLVSDSSKSRKSRRFDVLN